MVRFSFFLLLSTLFIYTTLAQETDSYDEYSLFVAGQRKEEEKRKKTDVQIPVVTSDTIPPIDTLQIDSLERSSLLKDSTINEPQMTLQDTTQSSKIL